MSFLRSDFISKFISMNSNDFHCLTLKHVHFDEHITDLVTYLKTEVTKIKTISLEDCDIGDSSILNLIRDCRNIETLEELHLINMGLNKETKEIFRQLADHKNLKVLDLRNNRIIKTGEIAALIRQNQTLQ